MNVKLKKFINGNIGLSIALAILGIIIAVFPNQTIFLFSYGAGVIMTIMGISLIISGRRGFFNPFDFSILGVALTILGINAFVNPERVAMFLPIMLGIWFISSSIGKLRVCAGLKSAGMGSYISALILSFVSMGIGVYFVINPMDASETIMIVLGILLTVYAIADFIDMIIFKKHFENVDKYFDEEVRRLTGKRNVKEVEVVKEKK